jgi:hypothetical protein
LRRFQAAITPGAGFVTIPHAILLVFC